MSKINYSILIVLFSFLISCGSDNNKIVVGQKTTIEIAEFFDAGEVLKGEKIEASFEMKNTGDYPLVVAEIKGSCTCTVVDKPDDPIAPDETYIVKAIVDTERTGAGAITKSISIVANTEPSKTTVLVKAMVSNNK